jgi:hypothetical protein
VRHADLMVLASLADEHTIVEGDALSALASLSPDAPTGELVCWA